MDNHYTPQFLLPKIIKKSWGYEKILIDSDLYCFKILHYDKRGNFSSKHSHKEKTETWYIKNRFLFYYFDDKGMGLVQELKEGDIIHLSKGVPHQLVAQEDKAEVYEVSTKDDPNDVIRISPSMPGRPEGFLKNAK